MNMKKMAQKGFTLIELMIVVAIIGILAAVAIPMFMDSMKKAKKSEAMIQLDKIGKKATEEYTTNATYPNATVALTPGTDCCTQGAGQKRKCAVVAGDWDDAEWRALDFSLDKEFFFQYSYTQTGGGTAFNALAVGDLDCDTTKITYSMDGKSDSGTPSTKIYEPTPNSD